MFQRPNCIMENLVKIDILCIQFPYAWSCFICMMQQTWVTPLQKLKKLYKVPYYVSISTQLFQPCPSIRPSVMFHHPSLFQFLHLHNKMPVIVVLRVKNMHSCPSSDPLGSMRRWKAELRTLQYTVFLQRGSCIYGMSLGSYYKILMILRWPELEFSKINVIREF